MDEYCAVWRSYSRLWYRRLVRPQPIQVPQPHWDGWGVRCELQFLVSKIGSVINSVKRAGEITDVSLQGLRHSAYSSFLQVVDFSAGWRDFFLRRRANNYCGELQYDINIIMHERHWTTDHHLSLLRVMLHSLSEYWCSGDVRKVYHLDLRATTVATQGLTTNQRRG